MNKDSKNTNKTSDDIRLNTSSFLDMKINPMQEPGNYLFLGNEWGFFGAVRDDKYYAEDNIDDGEKLYSVNLFNLAVQVSKGSVVYVVGKKNELEDYWSVILNKVATIIGKKFSYHLYYIEDFEKKFNISKKNEAYLKAVSYLKETKKLKFRYINMNPPYDKNLHLKIVEQSINLLTDDGILVNLSPIRWLQDPLAKYKKNSDWYKFKEVRERIESLVRIDKFVAAKMFDIGSGLDLGVYKVRKFYTNTEQTTNSIIDKVVKTVHDTVGKHIDEDMSDGWRVRVVLMKPLATDNRSSEKKANIVRLQYLTYDETLSWVYKDGFSKNGKHWHINVVGAGGPKLYDDKSNIPMSISFHNETEAVNFEGSTRSLFYRYLHLTMKGSSSQEPLDFLPFMGNAINPRTGKKGYESDWTDDDFRKYFDITDSEWEEIVETMKPYL